MRELLFLTSIIMAWDPEIYNQFREIRQQPFYNLLSHLDVKENINILDLGCGTGDLTLTLLDKFPGSKVTGIDNSREMLSTAKERKGVSFLFRTIEDELKLPSKYDLIIANASLQWVDDHKKVFNQIISKLNSNGQIAVQMPMQNENALNKLLVELADQPQWQKHLKNATHHSPLLSPDEYTEILIQSGATHPTIIIKVYPIVTDSIDSLYDFISGSALRPYLDLLPGELIDQFVNEYKASIGRHFKARPFIYSFKRMLIAGRL